MSILQCILFDLSSRTWPAIEVIMHIVIVIVSVSSVLGLRRGRESDATNRSITTASAEAMVVDERGSSIFEVPMDASREPITIGPSDGEPMEVDLRIDEAMDVDIERRTDIDRLVDEFSKLVLS